MCVCFTKIISGNPSAQAEAPHGGFKSKGKKNMVNMYKCNLLEILVPLIEVPHGGFKIKGKKIR